MQLTNKKNEMEFVSLKQQFRMTKHIDRVLKDFRICKSF